MKNTKPTAVYLRKSRAELAAPGVTLEKHRQILLEFASKHGIFPKKEDIYQEVVSGESLFTRPQMLALLAKVETGAYSAVLCIDLDRLGRGGMRDQGVILDAFKNSGTRIITPEKTYNLSDESDEELTELKTFISRRELKLINKRLRRGLLQSVKNGSYVSNAPYGYRNIRVGGRPTLEILPKEAEFVRMIFNMYTEGTGCGRIAEYLSAAGAVGRRGKGFSKSTVLGILKNPVYIGKILFGRGAGDSTVLRDGLHPAIVDEKLFSDANARLRARAHPPTNTGEIKNPYAGLIFCAKCGRSIQRIVGGAKKEEYLICPTKGCSAGVKLEYITRKILLFASGKGIRIYTSEHPEAPAEQKADLLEPLQKELARHDVRAENICRFYEDGSYDRAMFEERMGELEKKREETHREIARLRDAAAQEKHPPQARVYACDSEFLARASATEINSALCKVFEKIEYDKQKRTPPEEFKLRFYTVTE